LLGVGEGSPARCGSAQESNANGAYALREAQARDEMNASAAEKAAEDRGECVERENFFKVDKPGAPPFHRYGDSEIAEKEAPRRAEVEPIQLFGSCAWRILRFVKIREHFARVPRSC
jgi:hypothetical protein